jgi:creatinine deaminase
MLVLARMRDQSIIIGDDITVTVADIRGDKVRLGIDAPRHVSVHRKEVYEQIKRENQAAAGLQPGDVAAAVKPPPSTPATASSNAEHARFLPVAIEQAKLGLNEGGLPIGAVLVRNDQFVGRGYDRRIQSGDPTAVAEIECLRNAGRQEGYRDTVLYTTLTPGQLARGAVAQFGIPKIVVGDSTHARTVSGGGNEARPTGVSIVDLHDARCIELVAAFIREHPERWRQSM